MARRPRPACPVPPRQGISPTRIRLPADQRWPTLAAFLTERFPPHDASAVHASFERGDVFGPDAAPLTPSAPYAPGGHIWVFRPLPEEPAVPTDLPILYEDDHLLAVDKPHGLPVTPRGGFVRQTVTTLLRHRTGNPEISPAHRLDRMTAGVLLLTKTRPARGPVQQLFAQGRIRKTYRLIAPLGPALLTEPITLSSRIIKPAESLRACDVPGVPNARTDVVLLTVLDERCGLYEAHLHTGRTHQIRVHLNSLGRPILGDPLYPSTRTDAEQAALPPLQLLAHRLALTHPLTAAPLDLHTGRTLEYGLPGGARGPHRPSAPAT